MKVLIVYSSRETGNVGIGSCAGGGGALSGGI